MGELFSEFGDLVFTLVIGYMSAIEFLYVIRHLYHYSFNHDADEYGNQSDNLLQLQDSMRQQLANAKNKEAIAGTQVMKDGVPYKDGFRVEAQQALIDQLKQQLKDKALTDLRRQELEKELAEQMKIAEKLRKELAEAEAKYARKLKQQEEEETRKLREEQRKLEEEEKAAKEIAEKLKQKQKEAEERTKKEADENARKLVEAEKKRAIEQKKYEEEKERARQEAEENGRKLLAVEKQREDEQRKYEEEQERARQEAEENFRKLLEVEKQREAEQRKQEEEEEREYLRQQQQEAAEAEENTRRLADLEKVREEQQAVEESGQEILETERQREEEQHLLDKNEAAAARNVLNINHRLEEQLRAAERETELTEKERQLIEDIKKRDLPAHEGNEQREAELLRKILEAREQLSEESEGEKNRRLLVRERDQEAKQKRIDQNALLFLEAEKEMAELQAKMLDAVEKKEFIASLDSAPQIPVVEIPCIKKTIAPCLVSESIQPVAHTVKTQLAQDLDKPYSVSTKSLFFPEISDDASSNDPVSSQQSSFSTQPSEEITTGTESQYLQKERQEPDGEDAALTQQYSDDYLRSLDGIKQKPHFRDDGSGRRRAFKKRRSSNSSNSSRESRHSRDEELKMFASLEEEEMKETAVSDFPPIRYTTEPTLKMKVHRRRHKRSPAKDMHHNNDSSRSSLERLGEEETSNPWGEVTPEHYKNTEFWKREKTLSIDEEIEFERPPSSAEVSYDAATNMPNASSFEEATQMQNKEAVTSLKKYAVNTDSKVSSEGESGSKTTVYKESARSDNTNLQTSPTAEKEASPARSDSPRLRRSPRMEKINQYQEHWKETNIYTPNSATTSAVNTPFINVQTPLDFGPWRDEYGLIMEGLSDFYDFTASVNPSRSRSASRNPSPSSTAPNTPLPKDVSFNLKSPNENPKKSIVEIYDDIGNLGSDEFRKENIIKFIDNLNSNEENKVYEAIEQTPRVEESPIQHMMQLVADDPAKIILEKAIPVPMVNIITETTSSNSQCSGFTDEGMNSLVSSLRLERSGRSRSRSKSPLPTADNLQHSLENRRFKMIKHNEDILEKLIESKLLPELTPPVDTEIPEADDIYLDGQSATSSTPMEDNNNCSVEQMETLVESLHMSRSRSRSKSPKRLPTAGNLRKSLETRRSKLIERNDAFFKQFEERSKTPESSNITIDYVYEVKENEQTSVIAAHETPATRPHLQTEEDEDKDCSRERMDLLVQSLRVAQSRSRSKSPMHLPMSEKANQTVHYELERTKALEIRQRSQNITENTNAPTISVEFAESEPITTGKEEDEDYSREKMDLLVQSLRVARSRTRSKSPMRLPTANNLNKSLDSMTEYNDEPLRHMEERAKTPEPSSGLSVEYVYEFEHSEEVTEEGRLRHSRSKSPSRSHSMSSTQSEVDLEVYRSHTPSRSVSPKSENCNEFHIRLNLESSQRKTLHTSSEEQKSLCLANCQRQLDREALEKLKIASEETELRILSPLIPDKDEFSEKQSQDYLSDLCITQKAKLLRKSPTTPDYDRTISEEMRDLERIKQEMLEKGFKRSTYVGESMDLGSEFEPLRREAAHFQRSNSPSPSFSLINSETARKSAEEKRKIQGLILQELITSSTNKGEDSKESNNIGRVTKSDHLDSCEIELTISDEIEETMRIKEDILNNDFKGSTYAEKSVDETDEYEEMRRRNAKFRKSSSASRSPLNECQREELAGIEAKATERTLIDSALDEVSCPPMNFQTFSRYLNGDFFDNDRRASDSALISKPEIFLHFLDNDNGYLDPDEYHHDRRFSLAQEQPVEEYPSNDYIYIGKVEVRTRSGSRTWLREDFYSEEVDEFLMKSEKSAESYTEKESVESIGKDQQSDSEQADDVQAGDDAEEYSNNSDDDRQTVVEVDDEIDEDISDFNERGPAEESHHEISECEEAEREMDRYAGRDASDWNRVINVNYTLANANPAKNNSNSEDEGGAVGGLSNSPYDSDSYAIDKIYDDAIKNRKQSGILREYDSILRQMSMSSDIDEQYLLWSQTQGKNKPKNIEVNNEVIDNERKDTDIRYLNDVNVTARQSARLSSRYGYNPILQNKCLEDDLEVDLNYKPKREYNWRKNFKLDEENTEEDKEITIQEINFKENNDKDTKIEEKIWEEIIDDTETIDMGIDIRKCSLSGESVTLFNCSPEKAIKVDEYVDTEETPFGSVFKEEAKKEKSEKPKKKKTKKKLHKEARSSLEKTTNREDEETYDCQRYIRRGSIQMDMNSPKRKSRSRRSSKGSLINEDCSMGLFSSCSSVSYAEPIADILEEYTDMPKETIRTKKMKKRKKVRETITDVNEGSIGSKEEECQYQSELLDEIQLVSTTITPESSNQNILSILSPQNSVCVTTASIDTDVHISTEELSENSKETTNSATTTSSPTSNISRTPSITMPVDSFDILKDANFYPLF